MSILKMLKFILLSVFLYSLEGFALDVYTPQAAYQSEQNDVQVRGTGTVVKMLRDDSSGSRHQKFILMVAGSHTILVAHNIDLAPRIASIKNGDTVEFYGEYEWNAKGGVIPSNIKDTELVKYLSDIYHEFSTTRHPEVKIID